MVSPPGEDQPKPVRWVGSSKEDLSDFPEARAVYVLHAFQKKAKRGVATPKAVLELIDQRLRRAKEDYEQWSKSERLPTAGASQSR